MYITYKEKDYPCECRPSSAQMVYRGLPEDFAAPVDSEILLCADDGFVLRKDDPADYLRQTFEGGALTLTNAPEPVPVPEPTPTEKREEAYNTEKLIEYDGKMLTVTEAATLWQYYAAEGSGKADELTALIAAAKAEIREKYPDESAEEESGTMWASSPTGSEDYGAEESIDPSAAAQSQDDTGAEDDAAGEVT